MHFHVATLTKSDRSSFGGEAALRGILPVIVGNDFLFLERDATRGFCDNKVFFK